MDEKHRRFIHEMFWDNPRPFIGDFSGSFSIEDVQFNEVERGTEVILTTSKAYDNEIILYFPKDWHISPRVEYTDRCSHCGNDREFVVKVDDRTFLCRSCYYG